MPQCQTKRAQLNSECTAKAITLNYTIHISPWKSFHMIHCFLSCSQRGCVKLSCRSCWAITSLEAWHWQLYLLYMSKKPPHFQWLFLKLFGIRSNWNCVQIVNGHFEFKPLETRINLTSNDPQMWSSKIQNVPKLQQILRI